MVSTISSAGCRAASMARRTSSMREVAPVEVSLCTTHTALMAWPLSSAQPRLDGRRIGAAAPVGGDELRLEAQLDGDVLPQRGEVPGLVHQHLVAGRQRIEQRRLPRAGAGGGIDHHRAGRLEDGADAGEHPEPQPLELRPPVIDHRHVHRPQDAVRHRRRARDLQEMPAGAARGVGHGGPPRRCGPSFRQAWAAVPALPEDGSPTTPVRSLDRLSRLHKDPLRLQRSDFSGQSRREAR